MRKRIKDIKRNGITYRDEFITKLAELNVTLLKYGIHKDDIVITNGTVLEACGIRNSGDLDIIITSGARKIFHTDERIELTDTIEIKPKDSYCRIDDELIHVDKNHFLVLGYKFLKLEYCLLNSLKRIYKSHDRRDVFLIIRHMFFCG